MKIISFAQTTPALRAKRKSCTRRDWTTRYALSFQQDELVQAWDKLPRAHGKRIGTIRVTVKPYLEHLSLMPDSDYENEGFAFFSEFPEALPKHSGPMGVSFEAFNQWRQQDETLWVVRFVIEELFNDAF